MQQEIETNNHEEIYGLIEEYKRYKEIRENYGEVPESYYKYLEEREDKFINDSLELWAKKSIEDAISNIKNRKTKKINSNGTDNWVNDWKWLTDNESDFPLFCKVAGYKNPELIVNEVLRLSGARVEDGVKESVEWILAGGE